MNVGVWSVCQDQAVEAYELVRKAGHSAALISPRWEPLHKIPDDIEILFVMLGGGSDEDILRASKELSCESMCGVPVVIGIREADLVLIRPFLAGSGRDFVTLPCRPQELAIRFALLSGVGGRGGGGRYRFGRYTFELSGWAVKIDETRVPLPRSQYELALYLFRNSGRVVSRDEIRERLWRHLHSASRTIDTTASRVRKSLYLGSKMGCQLSSVHGEGYRLDFEG